MAGNQSIQSPRLAALQRQIAAGDRGALAALWGEVAAQGAPLVEPIAGDQQHMLVTFLWRAAATTRSTGAARWPTGCWRWRGNSR